MVTRPPMPPIGVPVVVDARGIAWLPVPGHGPDERGGWRLARGCSLGWEPFGGHVLIHVVAGGDPDTIALEPDGVAFTLTRDGLRQLVADLQSIDAQLGANN